MYLKLISCTWILRPARTLELLLRSSCGMDRMEDRQVIMMRAQLYRLRKRRFGIDKWIGGLRSLGNAAAAQGSMNGLGWSRNESWRRLRLGVANRFGFAVALRAVISHDKLENDMGRLFSSGFLRFPSDLAARTAMHRARVIAVVRGWLMDYVWDAGAGGSKETWPVFEVCRMLAVEDGVADGAGCAPHCVASLHGSLLLCLLGELRRNREAGGEGRASTQYGMHLSPKKTCEYCGQ
ncbi:hypothetical protein R3P38DRAFT_2761166 [Favolaschia claudopus]|uniref:Uncharacterized protein n=1 Tax=Favolaschia claudopus TaxID=2862362 RepID=A0AAW0DYJ7_9AGAR